jgi:hypothetical protein
MTDAAKNKMTFPGLAALRLVLLLVVALCLPETRVWGFGITAPPAPGVFESASPSSVGGITTDSAYDASDSPHAPRAGVETVQRAMSRAELEAMQSTGLVRGGRNGTHYVSDAVNSDALRARQRLARGQTPEVRVTMEVPAGTFSPPSRVGPLNNMPGGGMERTATGDIPARILRVDEY